MNLDGARKRCGQLATAAVEAIQFFNDIEKELKENRGDCKEPLIKDEKIRKAVRAWAEACGAEQVKYSIACNQYYDVRGTGFSIKFLYKPVEVWMEDGKIYTITELCGEEEE
jgi:hypothetical protein